MDLNCTFRTRKVTHEGARTLRREGNEEGTSLARRRRIGVGGMSVRRARVEADKRRYCEGERKHAPGKGRSPWGCR